MSQATSITNLITLATQIFGASTVDLLSHSVLVGGGLSTFLLALPGFGRERYLKLAPFVTALPPDAKLNVCSASGMVLDAYTGQRSFGLDPEGLAKNRASANGCFPKKTSEYKQAFASPAAFTTVDGKLAETSSYFRLTSHVTIGSAEFNLYSLLYREGTGTVRPLLRSYASD